MRKAILTIRCPGIWVTLTAVEPRWNMNMKAAVAGAYESPWMNEELAIFRDAAARFIESEMVPNESEWRKQQNVGKEIWRKAGAMGLLCTDVSAEYGGAGGDFRHEAVLYEELSRRGLSGFGQGVHSICAHYLVNHGTRGAKAPVAAAHGAAAS